MKRLDLDGIVEALFEWRIFEWNNPSNLTYETDELSDDILKTLGRKTNTLPMTHIEQL